MKYQSGSNLQLLAAQLMQLVQLPATACNCWQLADAANAADAND